MDHFDAVTSYKDRKMHKDQLEVPLRKFLSDFPPLLYIPRRMKSLNSFVIQNSDKYIANECLELTVGHD
jgi:hypothetical protein